MALKYECYFLNVPWTSDYKHLYYKSTIHNEEEQLDDIIDNSNARHFTNLNIIVKNNSFIIKGKLEDFTGYNYLIYKSNEQEHWTYAFITESYYVTFRGTIIEHQIDVFQTYLFRSKFKKTLIERGHITTYEDNNNWIKYNVKEPIGFPSVIDSDKGEFDISFAPILVMDTASKPTSTVQPVEFQYGGSGSSAENTTGIFRYRMPPTLTDRGAFIWLWSMGEFSETTISHLNDIQGFSFIPSWLSSKASWSESNLMQTAYILNNNSEEQTGTKTLSINDTLACGYVPDNKKMFTSLGRAFKIWNKNGLSIPLKPELLNSLSSIGIELYMRPMSSSYKLEIKDYKDLSARYLDLPYSYTIGIGFNSNTGAVQQTNIGNINRQIDVLKKSQYETARSNVVSLVNTMTGGLLNLGNTEVSNNYKLSKAYATGNKSQIGIAEQTGAASFALAGVGTAINIGMSGYMMSASIDTQLAQMELDDFNAQTSINDAYSSIGICIGNNSDRTNMSDDFCKLRLATCSPTYEECAIIDDFLSKYGYALNEFESPKTYFSTRSNWNYIKTINNSVVIEGCNNDNIVFKEIFNNGTTLWHTWNDFGDYSKSNT